MNTDLLVSVIVPCFNNRAFIRQCLDSVLAQSYRNLEIIVVDDGSTQNILEEIQQYVDDKKITYIRQHNLGQGIARNTGILTSNGSLILPFDSDDIMPDGYIEKMVPLAQDLNTVVVPRLVKVLLDNQIIDEITECQIPQVFDLDTALVRPTIPNPSMYSRSLWNAVGGYDRSKILRGMCEDWDLYIGFLKNGAKFVNADCFYYWRAHANNSLLRKVDQQTETRKKKAISYVQQKHNRHRS